MAIAPHILRRPGSANLYLRIYVPRDLVERFGAEQVWRSLKTPSLTEAKRRAPALHASILAEFEELRRVRPPEQVDIQDIAWGRYTYLSDADERIREKQLSNEELDEIWRLLVADHNGEEADIPSSLISWFDLLVNRNEIYAQARARRQAALRSPDAGERERTVTKFADREISRRGLYAPHGSVAFKKVAAAIQRAEAEALKRATERDDFEWGGTPQDPLVRPPASSPRRPAPVGERLMDYYERYLTQRAATQTSDTKNQNSQIIRLFSDFVGPTRSLSTLTRQDVRRWRDELLRFPAKAQQIAEFRGLSFSEVIKKNEAAGRATLTPKTVNRYLSALAPFTRWLRASDDIPDQILTDEMYLTVDRTGPARLSFSDEQLVKIFASPLFQLCQGDTAEHLHGNVAIRDWRYWIPLIALYSGMRLGEIAQLLVADIKQIHGTWAFEATEEGGEGKRLKTHTSARIVPIHSELIRLGLLTYRERCLQEEKSQLFAEIKPDKRGFMSGAPSKFLNGYFRKIGAKEAGTSFHSFRHRFADQLRAAGYVDADFGFILGHGNRLQTTTGRYGVIPQGNLEMRRTLIEAVRYDGVTKFPRLG